MISTLMILKKTVKYLAHFFANRNNPVPNLPHGFTLLPEHIVI